MRMVDADALVERIVKLTCVPCREKGNDYKGVKCRACQYGDEIDDIESAPTIERKTGKWVGIEEYCDHMNEAAAQEGKSTRYMPSGIYIGVYCNQCWKVNERSAAYCPNCGSKMEEDG